MRLFFALILVLLCVSCGGGGEGGGENSSSPVPSSSGPPSFAPAGQVTPDFGGIWCIPVFDGTDLVISTESGGAVWAAKHDLSLNRTGAIAKIADSTDTAGGDTIADHKHLFQNGAHYFTFSISGGGSGGYLYIVKTDSGLNRIAITTVVSAAPPTNDMFMVGDGTNVHVGKFVPGQGHRVYSFDASLISLGSVDIGGGANKHANGAVAEYRDGKFYLVAPDTLAPGMNDNVNRIVFDTAWNVVETKKSILYDPGMITIVSALTWHPSTETWIVHYGRGPGAGGGVLTRSLFDANWDLLSSDAILAGTWTRPHSVLVGDLLVVGYDGGGVKLSSYTVTDP